MRGPPFCYTDASGTGVRIPGALPLSLRLVSTACPAVSSCFDHASGLIAFAVVSFYFLALRLVLDLVVDAVVSWRPFLVLRSVLVFFYAAVSCLCLVILALRTARALLN